VRGRRVGPDPSRGRTPPARRRGVEADHHQGRRDRPRHLAHAWADSGDALRAALDLTDLRGRGLHSHDRRARPLLRGGVQGHAPHSARRARPAVPHAPRPPHAPPLGSGAGLREAPHGAPGRPEAPRPEPPRTPCHARAADSCGAKSRAGRWRRRERHENGGGRSAPATRSRRSRTHRQPPPTSRRPVPKRRLCDPSADGVTSAA
jgi:hypothetical protein